MTERVTDGRRIAELLASELTGRRSGPLGEVAIEGAADDVEPTAQGAFAYAIAYRGERVGEVRVRPTEAVIRLDRPWAEQVADRDGLAVDREALVVDYGAAVKRAADAIRAALAA